jgi:hypothetical protein
MAARTAMLARTAPRRLAWGGLELLTHLLLTPWFMFLLEGNPKLAGQQQKKAATAVQMCPRLVCFVHNILQVCTVVAARVAGG